MFDVCPGFTINEALMETAACSNSIPAVSTIDAENSGGL